MELLKFINKNKYKDYPGLMPTFETHYMQFERIREKAPTFAPMGLYDPRNFSRGTRKYNISINVFNDSFEKLEDGQDIRIIFKGNGTEECYILRNVKDIKKNNQYLCNYSLMASVYLVNEHDGKEYTMTYGDSQYNQQTTI